MNNLFALKHVVSAKMFAVVTIVSLILSAFPASFFVAHAANTDAVGTVAVFIAASPAAGNSEYVSIKFTGTGTLNLDGWTIHDDIGLRHTIGTASLISGETFVVCGDSSLPVACDEEINNGGNNVWNNSGDTMTLKDENGDVVHTVSWTSTTEGELQGVGEGSAIDYSEPVDVCPNLDDIQEVVPQGFNLVDIDCVPDDKGSITIKKVAGGDTSTEFDFSGGLGDFTLVGGDEHTVSDLKAGEYVVTETEADGWQLLDITCNDVQMNGDIPSVAIDLEAEEDVTCIFTNRPKQVEPPVCEIGENLLDNGSFEEPVVTDDKKWRYTDIIDWVITALSDNEEQDGELHRGWSGNEAADGEQYAELDSRESVKMAQTVSGLTDGATYELSWAFAPRHGIGAGENQLSVMVDGSEVKTEGPATLPAGLSAGDWTRNSYSFEAGSDSVEIAFADKGDNSDTFGTFLDDTALCFMRDPEPEEPDVCSYEGVVIEANQGLTNGGAVVAANRSDTSNVEDGVADYNNWGSKENGWSTDDFYSMGINGDLTYEFTNKMAVDQPGDDIAIWEITGGSGGQSDEKVDVYLSENGVDFEFAEQLTGDGAVDIADTTLDFVKYVKLVDQSNGVQGNSGDGFDLDAITIIDGSCEDYLNIHTTKIVCTDETDLPNWGAGGPKITADTATDWISEEHPSCEIVEGWEFEWGPKNAPDPGDNTIGPAGDPWTTFTGSTMVPASAFAKGNLWMREVLQEGYIPFTHEAEGKKNTDDYTAEFYCHKDVLNYDNYDRIDGPKSGEDYYCVGWNVPEETITQAPYCGDGVVNQLWEDCDGDDVEEGMICTDHCQFDNQCSMEQLVKITLDDTDSVSFDGSIHLDEAGNTIPNGTWFNFGETVGASSFVDIANSVDGLAVKRNNVDSKLELAFVGGNGSKKLDIVSGSIMTLGIDLGAVDRTPNPQFKLEDGSGDSFDDVFDKDGENIDFDLRADTGNDGVSVVIGQGEEYNCDDCLATVEARVIVDDYGTAGNGDLSDEIVLGDAGYTTVGFGEWFPISLAPAPGQSAVMIDDPNTVTNFATPGDKPGLFVSREDGTVKVVLYGEHNPGGSTNNEWINARIEVRDAEITNFMKLTGDFKFENHNGNNQPSDDYDKAIADSTGVDFKMWVDTASDGFKFDITEIDFCDDDSVDEMVIDGHKFEVLGDDDFDTLEGWTIELYDTDTDELVDTTTTNSNGYYSFVVPEGDYEVYEVMQLGWEQSFVEQNGSPVDGEYCSFDNEPLDKLLKKDVILNHVPEHEGGDYHCDFYNHETDEELFTIEGCKYEEGSEAGLPNWTVELRDDEGELVDTTVTDGDGCYSFQVPAGDYEVHEVMKSNWYQTGVTAYGGTATVDLDVNYCELSILDEENEVYLITEIVVPQEEVGYGCDFYNEQDEIITTNGGGGGESGTRTRRPEPEVAGATTMCPFLEDFMQIGWENDPEEVVKLQLFLNIFKGLFGGTDNPVTGVFDTTTDANVKAFQEQYRSEVLDPWYELGIVPHNRPTGFVYKTTLWKINSIICPEFAILPDFEGEDLTKNINEDID